MAKQISKLNILDFSPGIRAEYINQNFDLLKGWIEAERLRMGGWGLVEGFELSKNLSDFSVTCSEGVLINENGEEIKVDEEKFRVGPPTYRNIVEEHVVDENGAIYLQYSPYSNIEKHTIIYDPPTYSKLDLEEIYLTDPDTALRLTLKDIHFIDENIVIINSDYAGKKLRVNYLYANDRIDGIFLKKDGSKFEYELGIISTSPSHQDVKKYLDAGYYLIGFAYWHIGKEIDVEFITGDRSYRPIFVDKNGNIYLNGILYTGENMIYFIKPEFPKENQLWYDIETEILYIYRPDENGEYKWMPVNDLSRFNREYGVFSEDENPTDLRTFTFKDKANLRFVPGHNQLTIVIDQIVIMRDQFEELSDASEYDKDACTGYGFRLKNPLERPSRVEVYVDQSVSTKANGLELFPHIAAFIDIESLDVNDSSVNKILLESEYEIGNDQLEVWLNGRYLRNQVEFVEMTKEFIDVSIDNLGQLSNVFKILAPLNVGDVITYKVTRQMATYDNLRKVTDALNKKVDDAVEGLNETKEELEDVIEETSTTIDDLKIRVKGAEDNIKSLEEKKISEVLLKNLNEEVSSKLVYNKLSFIQGLTSNVIDIPQIKETDFFSIYYIGGLTERVILIKNEDYAVTKKGDGISIELDTKWLGNEEAKLYIEAIIIGS